MLPKKALSPSSSARRRLAVSSSIRPADEIGVDGHLLAGHGVEAEARGDFGDTAGTLGDDDEVDDHQDDEDHDTDDEIAARDEVAEGLDDVAGGIGAGVALAEDQARGGQVQAQPQHGGDQQHGREGREFERLLDEQGRHQDHDRKDDRDRQQQIDQQRRHRHDEDDDKAHDAGGERDIARAQHVDDRAAVGILNGAARPVGRSVIYAEFPARPDQVAASAWSREGRGSIGLPGMHRACGHQATLRRSPGSGTWVPSSAYWLSLLRRVRIEMPRMLAAWVRLPSV